MDSSKKKGVTVLVCTHNGEDNIRMTLHYLAKQKVNTDLAWEILIVNNASTDNTRTTALQIWDELKVSVPFRVVDEPIPGKDRAMDLGLKLAKHSYTIVCDDDNWLCETYVQDAFTIMENNPRIGVLGGKGTPVFTGEPPEWFAQFQTYYAVGPQSPINGEIRHFWPEYRFLWGAGAVINMRAYNLLLRAGFKRILTHRKYPKVARSEDLELCFAIWLTGYKLWYDKKLTYQHSISNDRLTWAYLLRTVKQSIPAIHYLRPYNILIFTGPENAPSRSYWKQYIKQYLSIRLFYNNYKYIENLRNLWYFILGSHKENMLYFNQALFWYKFSGILRLGRGYDTNYKRVAKLQRDLALLKSEKIKQGRKKISPCPIER